MNQSDKELLQKIEDLLRGKPVPLDGLIFGLQIAAGRILVRNGIEIRKKLGLKRRAAYNYQRFALVFLPIGVTWQNCIEPTKMLLVSGIANAENIFDLIKHIKSMSCKKLQQYKGTELLEFLSLRRKSGSQKLRMGTPNGVDHE